jgi:hypothetical protein
MFDTLFSLFTGDKHTSFISFQQTLYNLVKHFESDYMQEGAKNAAIDATIEILQSYKTIPVVTPEVLHG